MRVTQKGQVTIPKMIRERFGLRPGTEVRFVEKNHWVVLEKGARADAWDRYRGFLKMKRNTNQIFRELRGRDIQP